MNIVKFFAITMFIRNFSKFHNLYKVPFQNILSRELLYCFIWVHPTAQILSGRILFNTGGTVYLRLLLVFFTGFRYLDFR